MYTVVHNQQATGRSIEIHTDGGMQLSFTDAGAIATGDYGARKFIRRVGHDPVVVPIGYVQRSSYVVSCNSERIVQLVELQASDS